MDPRKHLVLNSRRACTIALALAILQFFGGAWSVLRALHSNTVGQRDDWFRIHGPVLIAFWAVQAYAIVVTSIRLRGRELLFVVGWFTFPLLIALIANQFPHWARILMIVGLLGPATAMLVALSLLLDPAFARHSSAVVRQEQR